MGKNDINNRDYLRRKEVLTSFFSNKEYKLMTKKQICSFFNIPKNDIDILDEILDELEVEGIIYIDESKRYVPVDNMDVIRCVFESKSERFGFGIANGVEDIYISSKNSLGAINNDEILVKPILDSNHRREGKVIKILKRNTVNVIGRFIKNNNFGFVEPIDKKIPDIYVPKKESIGRINGQIVEVRITKYATSNSKAEGKILRTIASGKDEKSEIKALSISYGLENMKEFSSQIREELRQIPSKVTDNDTINRVDRTKEKVYTIDASDAMDLDDAVQVKKKNDGYLLSVYIADVSNYVKEGTFLNKEAIYRGTSIYIPGTVIPMLPKKLSNGICSLNQGVRRLTLAIDILFDKDGNVIENNVFKSVIRVTKKMSYDKVYKVICGEDEEVLREYRDYIDDIMLMKELAVILNKKRKQSGSIDFDIPETKVVLDENKKVVDIKPYEITIANKIIEEFMLAANMQIAEKFYFLDIPFIYRIHEKPDEEKLRELNEILSSYKLRLKGINNIHPKALSTLIDNIEDEEEKRIISSYMLRTLKIAKYSEECLGHFGLAARYYCHFTSPIRRYPDLFIHRVISDYIESGYVLSDKKIAKYATQAIEYSKTSSETEKNATLIERDFDDLYKCIYMSKFVGDEFEAVISNVTSFGIFVRLENTVEGLISFDNINDLDYYIYDDKKHRLIGKETGKTFKIGDKLKVKLIRSDIKLKEIDFMIV